MATTRNVPATGQNWHDSLTGGSAYDDRPITWSVMVDSDNGLVSNFGAPNSTCRAAIVEMLSDLNKICAFGSSEVVSTVDTFTSAKMKFALGDAGTSGGSPNIAVSDGPGSLSQTIYSNTTYGTAFNTLVRGDVYWQTIYHESGHQCGMKHTYGTDAGNPVMDASISVRYNTVMTNRDYLNATGIHTAETYGRMAGWGYLDIQWLVAEYDGAGPGEGVNCAYSFTLAGAPRINGVARSAARPTGKIYEQLIGCTGVATIDMSGWTTAHTLDLNYGGWCRVNDSDNTTLVDLLVSSPGTQYPPGNFRIWPQVGAWVAPTVLIASNSHQTVTFNAANTNNTIELTDDFADCGCAGADRYWVISTLTQGVKTANNLDFVVFNGDLKPVSDIGAPAIHKILWNA